jgi:putative hydrolase of the HAD superfamily
MKNNFKAIIFDWGGVCCSGAEPFASPALQKILKMTPSEIEDGARDIYNGYYIGKYDKVSFWREIMKRFSLTETNEINPDALSTAYTNSYEIYQDVLDLILNLKKRYRIGLLSKLTPEMREHIKLSHDLKKYFEVEVYSCDSDVQSSKPDPKPFFVILDKMKLSTEDCLFIDDSKKNIEAATKIGMKTLLFNNKAKFFQDIKVLTL